MSKTLKELQDLCKRLRGKYSAGPDGVLEDRDFGTFTPKICTEAAEVIEELIRDKSDLESSLNDADVLVDLVEMRSQFAQWG